MSTGSTQPFRPAGTVSVAASTSSTAVVLAGGGGAVLVYNASATTAFFRLGAAAGLMALTSDTPVPAGARMLVDGGPFVSYAAAAFFPPAPAPSISRWAMGIRTEMSGTAPTSFTDAQKADIRRFCGFPAYGAGAAGFSSWRFFQAYGTLEYRLNNLAPAEVAVTLQYISTLATLETAIPPSSDNLDTESAAAWIHNANEFRDRSNLFDNWRRRLCGFLGVPPGPALAASGVSLVV